MTTGSLIRRFKSESINPSYLRVIWAEHGHRSVQCLIVCVCVLGGGHGDEHGLMCLESELTVKQRQRYEAVTMTSCHSEDFCVTDVNSVKQNHYFSCKHYVTSRCGMKHIFHFRLVQILV